MMKKLTKMLKFLVIEFWVLGLAKKENKFILLLIHILIWMVKENLIYIKLYLIKINLPNGISFTSVIAELSDKHLHKFNFNLPGQKLLSIRLTTIWHIDNFSMLPKTSSIHLTVAPSRNWKSGFVMVHSLKLILQNLNHL
jgi:hypothetical protein